jgi:hypothetical protein
VNVWKWSRAAFHVFCASAGNIHQRWHASDSRLLVLTIVQLASVLILVESGATKRESFSCVFDLDLVWVESYLRDKGPYFHCN